MAMTVSDLGRIAIVHDFFGVHGGAERVAFEIARTFPAADIYTSVLEPAILPSDIELNRFRPAPFNIIPGLARRYRYLLPVAPMYFAGLDLSTYDTVITSSIAFAKSVRTRTSALHICYCHTPNRYAWDLDAYLAESGVGVPAQLLARAMRPFLCRWDLDAGSRPTLFLANSSVTADRIRSIYRRDAEILHPCVDANRFHPDRGAGAYLLVVCRLLSYKRVDLAIDASARLGLPLKIVGRGPAERILRRRAGRHVEFLGAVPDADLSDLYQRAALLVVPGLEDFGITPLEAMAAGRPVVAYAAGGPRDTVVSGVTGILFDSQTVDSVAAAISAALAVNWDPQRIREHALRFDARAFRSRLVNAVLTAKSITAAGHADPPAGYRTLA